MHAQTDKEDEMKEGAQCQKSERMGRFIASLQAHVRYVVSSEKIKALAIRLDPHSRKDPVKGHPAFTVEASCALATKQCPGPHDSTQPGERWWGERECM